MKGRAIDWLPEELAFIEANCTLPRDVLHKRFCFIFQRPDVSRANLQNVLTRKGWSAGAEGRRRNTGKSLILSPDQTEWLRTNATLARSEVGAAFRAAFPEASVTDAQIVAWRKRNRVMTGRNGRFVKGQAGGPLSPEHKAAFLAAGVKTRFHKGQKSHSEKPDGYERIDRDGYVLIRVSEPNPWTGAASRMIHKHRWLWERANGPVPDGLRLKCLDGDKTNCEPSNWEAIPMGLAPRLNGIHGRGYDAAPAEVKPVIMAIAKLEHEARQAKRRARG